MLLSESGGGDRCVLVEVAPRRRSGALVVLALVFGSLLAVLPLVVAAVSILGTYLALLGLTTVTDVIFVVQYLVALIGLGVAIDYSLLVVTRWREELAPERDGDEAVRPAMATAGRSVLFSGVTVAVSLAALILVPLPFLRSIGLGGLLIPLFSVADDADAGPRDPQRRRPPSAVAATGNRPDQQPVLDLASPASVLAHRWLTIVGSTVVLLAFAAPVVGLRLGSPAAVRVGGRTRPASRADDRGGRHGVPAGVLRPIEVLVPTGGDRRCRRASARHGGVAAVAAPDRRRVARRR